MVTEDEILLFLSNNDWFTPSRSDEKKHLKNRDGSPMKDTDGNDIIVATSYYRSLANGTQVVIRTSNHGTDLDTWVRHNPDPTLSLQNASIVFSNNITEPKLKTYPHTYTNDNGEEVKGYRYFVVEEFSYNISNYDINGVKRIINSMKNLEEFDKESEAVFQDPFENNSKKRAGVAVLEPQDSDGHDIPPTNNPIHPRQTQVVNKRKSQNESKLIQLSETTLKRIISESINNILGRERRIGKYTVIEGQWWDGLPHGLEGKGCNLQDVRMYDSNDETFALWRRCDNLKFFYAKIVPDRGKETKWQAIPLSEVPTIIRNDFDTINPQGHEPYLRM